MAMTLTRRTILSTAGTLGTVAALAACGQSPSASPGQQSAGPVTLEWFAKLKDVPQDQIDAFTRGFSASKPNVTVNVTAVDNTAKGREKLATYMAGGNQVDAVSTVVDVPALRRLRATYALNDLIKRDKIDTSQFATNAYRGVEVKGKVLALPHAYAGNELALIANKSVFAKAGVPLPAADWKASWTWDQFREALKKLTNAGGSPPVAGTSRFGTIYNLPPMWGAQWATDDAKTVTSDSQPMIDAFTQYYDFVLKDRTTSITVNPPDWDKWQTLLDGKAALATMCCAVPTTTSQLNGVDWAFVPFPRAKAAVPDMGGTIIAIWPSTKSADTAWTFLRYAVDQGRLANLELRMPSQASAIAGYVQQNYGSLPGVRPEVFLKTADFIPAPDPLFQTPASDEADKLINGTFKEVAAGNKTVRAALTELKPQLQALLDQYRDL